MPAATRSVNLVEDLRTSSHPPAYYHVPCLVTCYSFPNTLVRLSRPVWIRDQFYTGHLAQQDVIWAPDAVQYTDFALLNVPDREYV